MLRELQQQAATTQQASAAIAKSLLPSSSSVSTVEHFDIAMFNIKVHSKSSPLPLMHTNTFQNHKYNQHDKENSLVKFRYQMYISLRSLLAGYVRSQQGVGGREGRQTLGKTKRSVEVERNWDGCLVRSLSV